jgi:hypothetical protein
MVADCHALRLHSRTRTNLGRWLADQNRTDKTRRDQTRAMHARGASSLDHDTYGVEWRLERYVLYDRQGWALEVWGFEFV